MPKIILETQIRAQQKIVFDVSRSVDAHQKSAKKTNEKAIAGKTSGLLELGDTVTWRAKHLGVYQNLTSKITALEPHHFFVDEMISGAFKSFRHEHIFKSREAGTLMTDVFMYQAPFDIFGKFANWLFLKKYMTRFLETRNLFIKEYSEKLQNSGLAIGFEKH